MTPEETQEELEWLRNQLLQMKTKVTELEERQQDHIGVDWGGSNNALSQPHPTTIYTHNELHGPTKLSVNSSFPMTFIVDYDNTTVYLHQARLKVRLSRVRSNVQTVSSGGGSTSGNGGATTATSTSGGSATPTSSSGGAATPTSSSGGSSTPTTSAGGSTTGQSASPYNYETSANNVGHTHAHGDPTTGHNSVTHTHTISGVAYGSSNADGSNIWVWSPANFYSAGPGIAVLANHNHTVTIGNHTHTVTIGNHTHTVTIAGHTHDVTLGNHTHSTPNHTHDLSYGIFEGPAPSTPAITVTINGVNRTTALGGPWNANFDVDITQYLRSNNLVPLRQNNTIVITSAELLDLEVSCKSLASSVPPAANTQNVVV